MKFRKAGIIVFFILVFSFLGGCSIFVNPSENPNTGGTNNNGGTDSNDTIELVDYKFKISNLPYESEDMKIDIKVRINETYKTYDIGTITGCGIDDYIEKTVKMPKTYSSMMLYIRNIFDVEKYYIPIVDSMYDSQTEVYNVEGYYFYYYDQYDNTSPYAACSEIHINALELDKPYVFNASKDPFMIFKLSNARDKIIGMNKENLDNVDFYVSTDKDKIMTYNSTKLTADYYECTANEVYFMIRTRNYGKKGGVSVVFEDLSAKIAKALEIDKAILASDGYLYASGTCTEEHSKSFLWKINPATGEKTKVTNFYNDIITIKELEAGTLYVSHDSSISTVNLETGEVSTLVSNLTSYAEAFVNYKDNKLVITGQKTGSSAGQIVLLDKTTGNWKEVDYYHYYVSHGNVGDGTELFYISDYDLFISNTSKISPRDISFMKLASDDLDAPKYYSSDSQYHGDYNMNGPTKIISTSPLQVLTAGGCVFTINTNLLTTEDYTQVDGYVNRVRAWAAIEGTSFRSYDDCIFTNNYVYYMNTDKTEDVCHVYKCALKAPKTVLAEEEYKSEKGIKFFTNNNKLYLLTNGTKRIYRDENFSDYAVYLHEIDF